MEAIKRQENDVKYFIDYQGHQIYLFVENIYSGFKLEQTYDCQYSPKFGYDISDLQIAEAILDGMIEKCKGR